MKTKETFNRVTKSKALDRIKDREKGCHRWKNPSHFHRYLRIYGARLDLVDWKPDTIVCGLKDIFSKVVLDKKWCIIECILEGYATFMKLYAICFLSNYACNLHFKKVSGFWKICISFFPIFSHHFVFKVISAMTDILYFLLWKVNKINKKTDFLANLAAKHLIFKREHEITSW